MKAGSSSYFLIALIALQGLCAAFFLTDVVGDIRNAISGNWISSHLLIEVGATLGLISGIVFETRYLMQMLRRNAAMEQNMRVATGAMHEVIQDYFDEWNLTPAERDVALFAIKGLSNAEIAGLRETSEGTVKAHLHAVFRKADVSGRNQLVSLLVEHLMGAPLVATA
ncbi:MAG: helix-turn-helix transcriptional regulator [Rhodobacteraceae bacterium]|nr:helix-turn-helix transcriptional regulator [Paracoccaceae bacterium]